VAHEGFARGSCIHRRLSASAQGDHNPAGHTHVRESDPPLNSPQSWAGGTPAPVPPPAQRPSRT